MLVVAICHIRQLRLCNKCTMFMGSFEWVYIYKDKGKEILLQVFKTHRKNM